MTTIRKSRLSQSLSIALGALVLSQPSLAQADATGPKVEEVISWGTKVYASSTSLDGDAMTIKQADHLSDLLRTVPGVDIGGAHSLNQRINIRGLDDKDLRISIDGANQNTYMYHHAGNLQIHADILKAVEIDVGTNSVINGGLGGSVRFETKEAKDLLEQGASVGARVQLSGATNASTGYSLTGYTQINDSIDIIGYYNYVDRDNYTVGGNKIVGSDGVVISSDGEVQGLAGETTDMLVKVGFDISPSQRFEIGREDYTDEGDYSFRPDMGLATDLAIAESLGLPLTYPTKFTRETTTANYDASIGSHSTIKATVFANDSELWRDQSGIAAVYPGDPSIIEGLATNTGFNVLASSTIGNTIEHTLTYGVDIIEFETEYSEDGSQLSGEDATNTAFFIEDKISFGNGFSLTPGVRRDSYEVNAVVAEDTFSDVTFALAAEKEVSNFMIVRASTTQLFKGPELSEVFVGAGLGHTRNDELKAETGTNSQLSFAWFDNNTEAGITFFQTDINDYIYEYADDNIGDLAIEGMELYFGFDIDNLGFMFSYSSSESELSAFEDYTQFEGARLDRSIGDNISLSLDYVIPAIDLSLHWEGIFVSDLSAQPDLDELNNPKDGHKVHNVSARWTPESVDNLDVILGVDNLLDEHYSSQASRTGDSFHLRFGALHLSDYEPGRNIKMTVSYSF